ncbi:transposase [Chelonobacter oris]|uniref:Mu transposase C-terminal domain-containing protein n=1 Tax=Chelonobacter oris TaxID=505317 RepID=UPI0024499760|nr:Mu transposase C-terminal domain-containing protein [Chelonobacter oris]MDH3001206.1 transposase [Chelonobacter oris]
MSISVLKTHYSAQELASMNLKTIPNTRPGVVHRAKIMNWSAQKRTGKGGGVEYALSSLPPEVQSEIHAKFALSVINRQPKKLPKVKNIVLENLTQKQRDIADARMALVAYVAELERAQSRIKAIAFICDRAKCGALPADVAKLVDVANARNGNDCGRVLSVRTLNQWVIDYHKCSTAEERLRALAPGQRVVKKAEEIAWLPDFLACYRKTNGVSLAEAYHEFKQLWAQTYADQPLRLEMLPKLGVVRYAMDKLPRHIKEIGRKTGAEMRALQTYVKRDWSMLKANDVWVGDGHSMKMKVAHPDHGRPFIPELTLVMDAVSRYVVGWSVSLSENVIAVADAIRHGVERHGIPAIYYSDNGGGEKNWVLDGDITGMLPRLGIHHETGIPGNPQGRGIIERINRTLALRIARQFDTYHGTGADRETVRKVSTGVISLDKAMRKGATELTEKQRQAQGKLPSWKQFIDAVEAGVEWYNNEHVHREIGMTPAQKRRQTLIESEVMYITSVEVRDMFRPQVIRTAQRGWISVFNNDYFSPQLINVDGQKVAVSFDIHCAESVIIRSLDGAYLCDAQWNGNKRAAFPVEFVERKRVERHNRRLKLKQAQAEEINAELNPVLTIERNDLLHGMSQNLIKQPKERLAMLPSELEYQRKKAMGA